MRLHCIVLNWKDADATIRCVESLLALNVPTEDILIVDNASGDSSVTTFLEKLPQIAITVSKTNRGFAGGMNLGAADVLARCDETDALLFLNNDARFLTDLSSLAIATQLDNVGLVSPLIVNDETPGKIEFQGSAYDWNIPGILWYNDEALKSKTSDGLIDSPRLSGAALVVSVRVARQIGLFDESFFMYFEDDDLSARSLKAGFRNVIATNAVLAHTGKSSKCAPPHYYFYMKRNEIYFWRKYLTPRVWAWYALKLWSEGYYNLSDQNYSDEKRNAVKDGLWSAMLGHRGPWFQCSRPKWTEVFFAFPKITARFLSRLSSVARRFQ